MPVPNPKNLGISTAGIDLGLGNQLSQQLEDEEDERRKKALKNNPGQYGDSTLGPASMSLLG